MSLEENLVKLTAAIAGQTMAINANSAINKALFEAMAAKVAKPAAEKKPAAAETRSEFKTEAEEAAEKKPKPETAAAKKKRLAAEKEQKAADDAVAEADAKIIAEAGGTEAKEGDVTHDDLRDLSRLCVKAGKKEEAKAVIETFGAAKLNELDPSKYSFVAVAFSEILDAVK